jgi:hypothetical protein
MLNVCVTLFWLIDPSDENVTMVLYSIRLILQVALIFFKKIYFYQIYEKNVAFLKFDQIHKSLT